MPIHGTLLANEKKEHDNLHELFMTGILGSCWCTCRRCWNSQRVYSICRFDENRTIIQAETPMHPRREDDSIYLDNIRWNRRKRF